MAEGGEQGFFIEPVGRRVEIWIGLDLESGGLEDLGVVGPGRLAEPDWLVAEVAGEKVAGDAQGAGAARARASCSS